MDNQQKPLDKYLSRLDVWALAFGCMVGWGAFVMPGTTFLPAAGPAGTLIAMAVGTLLMLIIGTNFTFLMSHSPGTGGVYSYTKSAFGRDHAFLSSWFLCLSYLTIVFLNATALFVVIRTLFGNTLQAGFHYVIAGNDIYLGEVGLSVVALFTVGMLFIRSKSLLQHIFTALAAIMCAGFVLIALVCFPRALSSHALRDFGTGGVTPGFAIFTLVILAPWAFVGFDVASFDTAHFKFPVRDSRWVIALSIIVAGFVYAAMSVVAVAAVPDGYLNWQAYISDIGNLSGVMSVPTFNTARTILGTPGLVIMGITAVAAILTGIIGAYRATTRVLSTMAEDRILSDRFEKTTYSILFIMLISIVIAFLGRNALNWFPEVTSFGAAVGYGYTSASAWKMAKAVDNRRVIVTSLLGTIISIAFVVVHLVPQLTAFEAMGSASFLLLTLWCLLGFVFYWRTVTHSPLTEHSGMSASGIALFALLVYSAIMWLLLTMKGQTSIEAVHRTLLWQGFAVLLIIFIGLVVMLYIQNLVREKHEALEREKIRAVEGSLAKSQFLFNMSHDIRTPMNAIIGYTHLLMKEEVSDRVRDYLGKIDLSSQHLLALINNVLEMSRIETGNIELEFEPTDLCVIAEEIRDLFANQMVQKGIDFTVHTAQVQDPCVWCDRQHLNRVLLNLLSNAYKFTPEGGTITASVYQTGADGEYGSYEFRVIDNGIGMSREFAEKMFNAFERERTSTVSRQEGTGLGLAITKQIVDLMGGTIEVITAPGSGTDFIVRLKFRLARPEDLAENREDVPEAPAAAVFDFAGKRVLLVEDNDINREIALMLLEQSGFMVETAENGQVAVDRVRQSQPGHYDAILMDIQMPVMDGYEATRAIRALEDEALASIPILAMTANAFKEDEEAAAAAGMQAHIAKPLDVDKMLTTLKEVLDKA